MPPPTKPQLAIYAALALAVVLVGARFLREQGGGEQAPPLGSTVGLEAAAGDGLAGGGAVGGAGAGGVPAGGGGTGGGADGASAAASADGGGAAGAKGASADGAGGAEGSGPPVVVDVKGAVRRPGVYELSAGARAHEAVREAGGMTRRADRLGVNLAARVEDGGEVVVPRRGARRAGALASGAAAGGAAGGAAGSGARSASGEPAEQGPLELDLNTASAEELQQLDGVGPATAAKIVAYRELHGGFQSVEELDAVSGIGEVKLASIRTQLGL